MTLEIGKQIYAIFTKVMHQQEYAVTAENFQKSSNELQNIAQSFSKEQWDAVTHYRDAFMDLHETMMLIALEKNEWLNSYCEPPLVARNETGYTTPCVIK